MATEYWCFEYRDETYWAVDDGGKFLQVCKGDGTRLPAREKEPAGTRKMICDSYGTEAIEQSKFEPGQHHRRMWRGNWAPAPLPSWSKEWASSVSAAESLFAELRAIFRVVEPDPAKCFGSYGHGIRELLMLACMEVESGWKAVLKANNAHLSSGKEFNRNDYGKLLDPMRLADWEVFLPMHPQVGDLKPFANWIPGDPVKKLTWYDAYNGTKHDREDAFADATLGHALNAVAAVFVMVLAQFGTFRAIQGTLFQPLFQEPFGGDSTFRIRSYPRWPLGERYIPPPVETQQRPLDDWKLVDCPGL